MSQIHPTAVIEPGARLGAECVVGPYAFIGARVRLGTFTIGDATAKNMVLSIARDSELAKDAPYDGLLSNDFFKQYDVEIDFGTNRMTWLTPTQCTDPLQVVYWTHDGVATVPMILESGLLKVPVTIEGHSIVAVIDTSSTSRPTLSPSSLRSRENTALIGEQMVEQVLNTKFIATSFPSTSFGRFTGFPS